MDTCNEYRVKADADGRHSRKIALKVVDVSKGLKKKAL